eukprot:305680_1
MASRKRKQIENAEESQTNKHKDETSEVPLKKRKIDVHKPMSLYLINNEQTLTISDECVIGLVILELCNDKFEEYIQGKLVLRQLKQINVIDTFQEMVGGILTAEEFKKKEKSLNILWQTIFEKATSKELFPHMNDEWERRIIALEPSFVHEPYCYTEKQVYGGRLRNTKYLSELLKIIEICGLKKSLHKIRLLVMNWMRDYNVTEEALKSSTKQLIDVMDKNMNILFNYDLLKSKSFPPSAQKLFDAKQYSHAVACVMMMDRKNVFEIEELIQCSKWLCHQREAKYGFQINFFNDGKCRIGNSMYKYELKQKTWTHPIYGNNPYIQIDYPSLRSNGFWCFGRDKNWGPKFVQCYKHETDYLIYAKHEIQTSEHEETKQN